jgi:CO/xanthine dehydrogenase FAD-binding subunit
MRLGVEEPDLLVDVTRLPYDRIEETSAGGLRSTISSVSRTGLCARSSV